MNSRRGDSKDEKPNQAGLEGFGAAREHKKQLMWVGYCVAGPQPPSSFRPLRMYTKPPHSRDIASNDEQMKTSAQDSAINEGFDLRKVREHDLLLLSPDKLDLKGSSDIKKVLSADFLCKLLSRTCSMLALVT